jgi:hypothetical protein
MALLVSTRCYRHTGGAAQESIDEVAEVPPIIQRADQLTILWRGCAGLEVRPFGGDQRLTPVRQNQNELQSVMPVRASKDRERLSVKRVMWAGDRHPLWEVPEVGSVWWFPSGR